MRRPQFRSRHRNPKAAFDADIIVSMAGNEAEEKLVGRSRYRRHADTDLRSIAWTMMHGLQTKPEEVFVVEERLRAKARQLVRKHRNEIARVAEALGAKQKLTGAEVDDLIRTTLKDGSPFQGL